MKRGTTTASTNPTRYGWDNIPLQQPCEQCVELLEALEYALQELEQVCRKMCGGEVVDCTGCERHLGRKIVRIAIAKAKESEGVK